MKTCGGCDETDISKFYKDRTKSDGLCTRCRMCTHASAKKWRKDNPEWGAWHNMIQRCGDPTHEKYVNYGARGIIVCERWFNSYDAFFKDMGPRPGSKYSIDRKNNAGNYTPSNCRWVLQEVQANNTRTNHVVSYKGESMTIAELAAKFFPGTKESLKARKAIHQYIAKSELASEDAVKKHATKYPNQYKENTNV